VHRPRPGGAVAKEGTTLKRVYERGYYDAKEPKVRHDSYREFIDRIEKSPEYAADVAALELADALNEALLRAGIDVADLAARTGLSHRYLRAVLRGDAALVPATVERIAAAIDTEGEVRTRLLASGAALSRPGVNKKVSVA